MDEYKLLKKYKSKLKALKRGNTLKKAELLYKISKIYNNIDKSKESQEYGEQALSILEKGFDNTEGMSLKFEVLNFLSKLYAYNKDYKKAFNCLKQTDRIVESINNKEMELINKYNWGIYYAYKKNVKEALTILQKACRDALSIKNEEWAIRILQEINNIHYYFIDYKNIDVYFKNIKEYYEKELEYAKKIRNYNIQIKLLYYIGLTIENDENTIDKLQAIKYYKRALTLCRKYNNVIEEINILFLIGSLYCKNENELYGKKYFNTLLKLLKKDKDKEELIFYLLEIGNIYYNDVYDALNIALKYYKRALKIAEKEDYTLFIADALLFIGNTYKRKDKYTDALEYYSKVYKLALKLKDIDMQKQIILFIAEIYHHNIYNKQKALFYYKKLLKIYKESGSKADQQWIEREIEDVKKLK